MPRAKTDGAARGGDRAKEGSSTSSASPRVSSLAFCRLECDHAELFEREYKRSNRTKGLKILRCFPHCCPNHIERSYCGSSLHVIVQTETGVETGVETGADADTNPNLERSTALIPTPTRARPTPTPSAVTLTRAKLSENLFLFARFECSTDHGLQVGDELAVGEVARATQSEANPEGRWIPGLKERASTVSSARKSIAETITENTLVYQLNGKVYSRWYYDWESGANKAQRLMCHMLKAYVFEKRASGGSAMYRVLGIVASPEFTVISYRRAPLESAGLGTKGSETGEDGANGSVGDMASPGRGRDQRPPMHPSMVGNNDYGESGWSAGSHLQSKRSGGTRIAMLHNSSPAQIFEDRVVWEHMHSEVVTTSKNLALIYSFLQWTSLEYYASFIDGLVHMLNTEILAPIVTPLVGVEKLNCFARVLLDHAQSRRHRPWISRDLETLLRVVAQAALYLCSDRMRWWMHNFVQRRAEAVVDKQELRAAFVEWITGIEAQLNQNVFSGAPLSTLAQAAEEIIAAVYTHEMYHPKRPVVRQILGEHGFLGWRMFVAQMRDSYIAQSTRNRPRITIPTTPTDYEWSGDWMLDMDESLWKPCEVTSPQSISLLSVLDLVTQITRLRLMLNVQQRALEVRSHTGFAGGDEAMTLILDGKSRVFRFSPNGLSSALGEGAEGDYVGTICLSAPDRLTIVLESFRWSHMIGSRSYHTRLRIEYGARDRLWCSGDVLETSLPVPFSPEQLQYMGELTIAAKLKAIDHLHNKTQDPRCASSNSSTWRTLGDFQLVFGRPPQ